MAEEVVAPMPGRFLRAASDGEPVAVVLTLLISRSFRLSVAAAVGMWVCGQGPCLVHKSTGLRAQEGIDAAEPCSARDNHLPNCDYVRATFRRENFAALDCQRSNK